MRWGGREGGGKEVRTILEPGNVCHMRKRIHVCHMRRRRRIHMLIVVLSWERCMDVYASCVCMNVCVCARGERQTETNTHRRDRDRDTDIDTIGEKDTHI